MQHCLRNSLGEGAGALRTAAILEGEHGDTARRQFDRGKRKIVRRPRVVARSPFANGPSESEHHRDCRHRECSDAHRLFPDLVVHASPRPGCRPAWRESACCPRRCHPRPAVRVPDVQTRAASRRRAVGSNARAGIPRGRAHQLRVSRRLPLAPGKRCPAPCPGVAVRRGSIRGGSNPRFGHWCALKSLE